MPKTRRSLITDPSLFKDIKVSQSTANTNSFFQQEEVFFDKGGDSGVVFENEDVILLRGSSGESDIRIDLANARKMIQDLRDNWATSLVKDLSGTAKENFLSLVELAQVLHQTPAYSYLHELITKEFGCDSERRYRINTVGAYFCECQQSTNFPGNNACSLGCLTGLQPEEGCRGFYPCDHACLVYNGHNSFTMLNGDMDRKQCYLFVSDQIDFQGLSSQEVQSIRDMGVESVKIVKHSEGLSYQEISSDFVNVERLSHRPDPAPQVYTGHPSSPCEKSHPRDNQGDLLLLVVLILIILLLCGGYYVYMRR
jgi:hypothetical protein